MFPVLVGLGQFLPDPETLGATQKTLHDPLLFAQGEIVSDHGDELAIRWLSPPWVYQDNRDSRKTEK